MEEEEKSQERKRGMGNKLWRGEKGEVSVSLDISVSNAKREWMKNDV